MRDARQVGVVEVEHVAGGPSRGDGLQQAVARGPRGARRPLLAPAVRAREPVEKGGGVAHRSTARQTQAISAPCSGSREPQQRLGHDAEALGVDRHVHVGREDREQRGDQPPARQAARSRYQHAGAAGELGDAAGEHDLALARQRKREIVFASGVAELAGGAGVLVPRTRRGGWWLIATLLGDLPGVARWRETSPVDVSIHSAVICARC